MVRSGLEEPGDDRDVVITEPICGAWCLVGTQQIEDKVDRERLNALFSEYQRWLEDRRPGQGWTHVVAACGVTGWSLWP